MEMTIPEPSWVPEEEEDGTFGIQADYCYKGNEVVELLREHKANPAAIAHMVTYLKEVEFSYTSTRTTAQPLIRFRHKARRLRGL